MHVVVIGAGVIGLCSAWFLTKSGHRVTVLDRGAEDGDKCSMGNSGIVVPSHFTPLAAPGMVAMGLKMMTKRDSPFRIKPSLDPELARWCFEFLKHCTTEHVELCAPILCNLNMRSRALYEEFAKEWGDEILFGELGLVVLCSKENSFEDELREAARAKSLGLNVEILEGTSACDVHAGLSSRAVGGVHYHDDVHMAPHLFVRKLREALDNLGVEFLWETEATGWVAGLSAVESNRGSIEADAFVVAGGSWSARLARSLGFDLLLQPGKGMSLEIPLGASQSLTPIICKDERVAVTPMGENLRFGGTLELGEWDLPPDKVRVEGLVRNIKGMFPSVEVPAQPAIWTGLRPCTPDGMPYIGAFPDAENVLFATGHAMLGLSLGPVTGQIVAGLLDRTENPDPRLSPGRFA